MTETPGAGFADAAQRYRLDSRIATGGMGEVWRGTDTVLGRRVAVKLLKIEYADDASFRVRFESEAQHAASLHHPNIASVYDFGEGPSSDGSGVARPYLVMELVDGQPLSALIRPGVPMSPVAMRELLAQAADGLGVAHAAGIVHRDVKPANLLVTPDRQVKVTDFGIARAVEGVGLTGTGEVMGTPQYLSPEQAEGRTATAASDVYSLGVVAFECLAGRRPFQGESAVATALAHIREPVPTLPAEVPSDLAAVVTRALAKDPADRYRDGRAMAAALRDPATAAAAIPMAAAVPAPAATQVLPPVTAPVSLPPEDDEGGKRRAGWLWPVLAVIALVLIAILVFLLLTRSGDDGDQPTEDRTSPTETASTTESSPSAPTTSASADTTVRIDESDYLNRPVSDVQRELADLGLRVVTQAVDNPGDQIERDVSSVNPTGVLNEGDEVVVTYWGPAPPSPTTSPSETTTPSTPESPTDSASETS